MGDNDNVWSSLEEEMFGGRVTERGLTCQPHRKISINRFILTEVKIQV